MRGAALCTVRVSDPGDVDMGSNLREKIERWFKSHEDGEFCSPETRLPYSVIGPSQSPGTIVYTTKPSSVALGVCEGGRRPILGMVGRYGLPSEQDAGWLRDLANVHRLVFLGDLDPPDLLIYAWMIDFLRPNSMTYLGISDQYISALSVNLPKTYVMTCTTAEHESLPLLKDVFPEFESIIGSQSAQLLADGKKIEIEAVVSALGSAERLLQPAVTDPQS